MTAPPLTIRPAVLDDALTVARVHYDTWQTTYHGIMPPAALQSRPVDVRERQWRRVLEEGAQCLFVAERDGEIVGFANGGKERGVFPDYTGELYAIYLLENAQRGGIGRVLVQHVAAWLSENGHNSMLVWVFRDNPPARQFYESLGGVYVGEQSLNIEGTALIEVAYGWRDLRVLAAPKTAQGTNNL